MYNVETPWHESKILLFRLPNHASAKRMADCLDVTACAQNLATWCLLLQGIKFNLCCYCADLSMSSFWSVAEALALRALLPLQIWRCLPSLDKLKDISFADARHEATHKAFVGASASVAGAGCLANGSSLKILGRYCSMSAPLSSSVSSDAAAAGRLSHCFSSPKPSPEDNCLPGTLSRSSHLICVARSSREAKGAGRLHRWH